jgi:hypothetical protein
MKRRANKPNKSFKNTILCFCEGETEKEYLTCLKKDRYANLHIELKPLITKTGFNNIFNKIEQQLAEPSDTNYKYIFYVLDLDAVFKDHKENEYNVRKKKVESLKQAKGKLAIIESRPCIEFWFLLHCAPNKIDRLYTCCYDVVVELCNTYPDYCKKQKYIANLYKKLKGNLEIAMERSKAICEKDRIENQDYSYTQMHQLIQIWDELH